MDFNKFLAMGKFEQHAPTANIPIQTEKIALEPNTAIESSNDTIYGFFVWMIVLYAGSWVLLEFSHKFIAILSKTKVRKLSPFSLFKSRCRKCQFFDDNNYLSCALHPSIALTNEAVNCPDYERNLMELPSPTDLSQKSKVKSQTLISTKH